MERARPRFGEFLRPFQDLAARGVYADLHIGVVTSDYGAGNGGSCSPSPGGQRGALQALGAAAPPSCKRPSGANFVAYKFGPAGAAQSNLPDGQGLSETFTCMASVGSKGCGFEHPLESVRAALQGNLPENQGFLRDDAVLAVVFLANEDDASAPPDTDLFSKDTASKWGHLSSYPRQTRHGILCCPPGRMSCENNELVPPPYGASFGPLAGCRPSPNSPMGAGPGVLYDVSRYVDLFTKPAAQGGIKVNPLDVVLIGIDGPDNHFEVILSDPGTPAGQPYVPCAAVDEKSCLPVLQHACQDPERPGFFGDPAVRLNQVIRAAQHHTVASICSRDYTSVLNDAAREVVSLLEPGCLGRPLPRDPADPSRLAPDCDVIDSTANPDGTTTKRVLPRCEDVSGAAPCWRIESDAERCAASSPDSARLIIEREGEAPPHTTAELNCAYRCE